MQFHDIQDVEMQSCLPVLLIILLQCRCAVHVGDLVWVSTAVQKLPVLQCPEGTFYAMPLLFLTCLEKTHTD